MTLFLKSEDSIEISLLMDRLEKEVKHFPSTPTQERYLFYLQILIAHYH
ncbi:hypothetical protein F753_01325 [Stutzerimonas chloritidismutans AW-1]|uniref:Uncharacterized protein n=1 Tax=Stutzerimonas chloritidismutans AW-1 TaxID=1263865 RepID=V4QHP5_STUCH|nr:hypothetical protein F753_01255 [Stutzerimonas chloritidismutans AW-1]ESR01331.1 hypothetical protein F753_01325 [Stutzerimonas chloritidismutans AW-1]